MPKEVLSLTSSVNKIENGDPRKMALSNSTKGCFPCSNEVGAKVKKRFNSIVIGFSFCLSEPKFIWIYSPSRKTKEGKIPETKVSK